MLTEKAVNKVLIKRFNVLIFLIFFFLSSFGQNQNISEGIIFDGEPYIAINPQNSQQITIVWMGYIPFSSKVILKLRVSSDGGQTWSDKIYIPHVNSEYSSADPSLAYDNSGNLFLSYIDYDKETVTGAIYVRKSTDNGLTWNEPIEVINVNSDGEHHPVDRPWISIDRTSSSNDGNIYITSMPPTVFGYLPPPYHPYFIKSVDGGQSFETWQYLDTINWLAGLIIQQPMPTNCVSSDGTFYAVYPSYVYSQNPLAQFIIASTEDAGNSFAYHTIFASSDVVADSLVKAGYLILANPINAEHLTFFYLSTLHGDIDVFMRESFDKGVSWSNEIRLNDDVIGNNKVQDLLWADFNDIGDLIVTWRDRRNGIDTTYETASEIWGTIRKHNSSNFSENFKISEDTVQYDTILAYSGNDFMCTKLIRDTLNSVWGDTRNGKLNIWFARKTVDGNTISVKQICSEFIPKIYIYPNPCIDEVFIEGHKVNKLTFYNEIGQIVYINKNIPKSTVIKTNIHNFPDGIYYVKIDTEYQSFTKKIIKHSN